MEFWRCSTDRFCNRSCLRTVTGILKLTPCRKRTGKNA
jgi:hypothetical protein